MANQLTPAQLLRIAVEGSGLTYHEIERRAGTANGSIRAWTNQRQCPRMDNLIAAANVCGYRVVIERMDGK